MNITRHTTSVYTYDNLKTDYERLIKSYSNYITGDIIGKSVLGRDIYMFSAGSGKTTLFISAGVHGRESINTRLLMMIAEAYINMYYCTDYYDNYCIRFIPLLNPDGYIRSLSRKEYYDYKCNAAGIDINRDFPSKLWRPGGNSYIYPGSQPETRALMNVFNSYPSSMYVDIHSRGNSIYYYRQTMGVEYNKKQRNIAKYLAAHTGYRLMPPEEEINPDDSGGNTVHYYSEQFNMPAITIETCADNETFPMRPELAEEAYNALAELPVLMIDSLKV